MSLVPANQLKVYRNFKSIECTDFRGLVRYYERHEDEICSLDFEEYFDCTVAYTHALFEINSFGKHIVMSDHLLETIMMQNIESWGAEDIYTKILFGKALSLYNLDEFAKSEHILRELVKINPWDQRVSHLLKKCLINQRPSWLPKIKKAALLFILLSALTFAIDFLSRSYYPIFGTWFRYLPFALFGLGLSLIIFAELIHLGKIYRKTACFINTMKSRKSQFSSKKV